MIFARPAKSLLTALLFSAAAAPALAGGPADGPARFVAVDYRVASGVAATLDAQDSARQDVALGQSVRFGQTLEWHDGRTCDLWTAEEGTGPDAVAAEPNLADLQTGLGGDAPNFVPVSVTCQGEPFADYVRVDDRVLIGFVPNGTLYVVMERAPNPDEAMAIQQALAALGHYSGPLDGVVGDQVRAAIADFIATQGGPRPAVGILSQSVVDTLLAG